MEQWLQDFEHSSITDENRDAFNTHMGKFPTQADAVADGYGLAQMKGKPTKLPESMEGFADDTARAEFRTNANRLLGITHAKSIEDLAGLDLKQGSASDKPIDENLANSFKQLVIDKKIPISIAQDVIGHHNQMTGKAEEAFAIAAKTAEDETTAKFVSDKRACNDALVAHADFASQEVLDKQDILLHRALKDNAGITIEEADSMAEFLRDREGATNPVLRRLLINAYAPMAAESSTEVGDGKTKDGKTKDGKPALSEAEQKKEAEVKKVLKWN